MTIQKVGLAHYARFLPRDLSDQLLTIRLDLRLLEEPISVHPRRGGRQRRLLARNFDQEAAAM